MFQSATQILMLSRMLYTCLTRETQNRVVFLRLNMILGKREYRGKTCLFSRRVIFVSPERSSERDYVITHSVYVCSMYVVCMYSGQGQAIVNLKVEN